MRKPSWSCLGALLMALMFQASVEVHGCSLDNPCKDSTTAESLLECIKSCSMDSSNILEYRGIAQNELKRTTNYSHKKYKQRDIHSGSISSDGRNVNQKRQELIQGDFLDLFSPGVRGEDKEVQEEGLSLIRPARQLDNKRSYSMEHFRWGKPVGKKRRPVKVYPNGVEEESTESHSTDFRRDLPMKIDYLEDSESIVDRREDTMEDIDKKKKKEPVKIYRNGVEEESTESPLPMSMNYPEVSELIFYRGKEADENKERYKMEHFRWGKPLTKKRRPVKVYHRITKEESAESHPMNFRRDLPTNMNYPEVSELIVNRGENTVEDTDKNKKNKRGYNMEHFWWGTSPRNKRYGGFMVSEKSHTPLMTLFRNAIIKNAPDKGQ
ncbi:pro-opiomelanocortin [Sarcophilus harrisii]|uniref:Pro-opiomelanocortin n=1 Tax=Sarcophilus harrisii TaxID=9305 RepID=A0A7N4NUF0_SARHA|nr:pro-opiomelanocortin [Sarcophilus harrisii]XP_031807302.1 pro-opiomelanocortin [Sarcophilus harrisii]